MILGIDEVGRGPWAGPLVVGAVVLGGAQIEGLTDSKKLSKKRREELDILIREQASGFGLGWVEASEIDEVGLSRALVIATMRAVEQIKVPYHEIIIDGTINFLKDTSKGQYVTTMKKADLLVPAVSAASIIAKVARDAYMTEQARIYPKYAFSSHVGYGTAAHIKAISEYGITPLHRLSVAPLAQYRVSGPVARSTPTSPEQVRVKVGVAPPRATRSTTKQIGDSAETVAANYLAGLGHTILDRNWKTKFCEIDIISTKDKVIYFNEVKYRKNSQQGGGLAALTSKKVHQMKFAVELYTLKNKITNTDLRLVGIAVTGTPPKVENILEVV